MKRLIKWKCQPASFGYHLVATTDIGGKPTDVNVAIDKQIWEECVSREGFLSVVTVHVGQAFDIITAEQSRRPPCATLH
jgi:hypothetical protein